MKKETFYNALFVAAGAVMMIFLARYIIHESIYVLDNSPLFKW